MKCKACGVDVSEGGVFCHRCGERMDADPNAADTLPENQPASNSAAAKPDPVTATSAARRAFQPRDQGNGDVEDAIWQGGFSAKAMLGSWLGGTLLSIAVLVGGILLPPLGLPIALVVIVLLWLLLGLTLLYRKWSMHYELTSQRFIHQEGILKRTTDRIEVIDMDDITFEQGLVERMLGVGTIKINSSDTSHPVLLLRGIDDVKRVANLIDSARRKERVRRGIHVESI